jgi:hypothetical protein
MKKSLFGLGAMIVGSVVFWFFYATNYFHCGSRSKAIEEGH